MMGRADVAEAILECAEAIAGPRRLFAEGVDPLTFSRAEHVRAVLEIDRARGTASRCGP